MQRIWDLSYKVLVMSSKKLVKIVYDKSSNRGSMSWKDKGSKQLLISKELKREPKE